MKKFLITAILSIFAATSFAGGKGGSEVAIASYGGLGATVAVGIPLNIKFLASNGLHTYGELEVGVGVEGGVTAGAELSGGVLVYVGQGLSVYGSLGPAIGIDAGFGLGAEIGFNIDVNSSSIFIEGGTHPGADYVAVGLRL
ncbi:hypothetical protein QWZ13_09295 [Reinekea marina]|uniref:Outer membrane protein with beta-barrel domain n=1 Tax=Reinekea marina TaxID=1310421 RepID=A0ABV7WVQ7_9GAMM|nr:hypothetical protein [Reinekea marina]MDN3649103.1 hypothetical protein [Reinekea marina]